MTWGKDLWDQFDSIAAHTLKGIEFTEKFAQFIKERCIIEFEYAARLKKLVKNYQPKKKDEDSEWTSVKGFTAMITEVHDIAGQHEMIADNLSNSVVKELQNLVQQVKLDRKKHLAAGQKQHASLQLQIQSLDKCKKQYEKSFREAEKAQEGFRKADADRHMSKADVEKAQNLMIQKQQHCEECKNEYASELQKTNECQTQHYNFSMTLIFEQLQEMEEKRITRIQELLRSCADIERDVLPIINTCISGMIKAADSVSFNEDSQGVIDKFKSGFLPPEDIPFEDLSNPSLEKLNNSTPSSTNHHSSLRLDSVRSSFSAGSIKSKRKTRLLNIFSGSKSDEIKEDYSHLPPNQQKKKLNQRISTIKSTLAKETAERDGMLKMQDVYRQNPALGDPMSLSKQLEENGQKLDKLRVELQKFESYLREIENTINTDPKARFSISLQGSPISTSHGNNRSEHKVNLSRNDSLTYATYEISRTSGQSTTADQDSFDDIDDDDATDGDLLPIGKCVALYPFDAPNEGSISMYEGEEFHIMEHDQGDGWMRVRRMNNLEEGFVPTSYVEIDKKRMS